MCEYFKLATAESRRSVHTGKLAQSFNHRWCGASRRSYHVYFNKLPESGVFTSVITGQSFPVESSLIDRFTYWQSVATQERCLMITRFQRKRYSPKRTIGTSDCPCRLYTSLWWCRPHIHCVFGNSSRKFDMCRASCVPRPRSRSSSITFRPSWDSEDSGSGWRSNRPILYICWLPARRLGPYLSMARCAVTDNVHGLLRSGGSCYKHDAASSRLETVLLQVGVSTQTCLGGPGPASLNTMILPQMEMKGTDGEK